MSPDDTLRPELRDEILADLEDIAQRDPKWALAKAFEFGYSAGRHDGTRATLDRLFPLPVPPRVS
jgi:hypothetical protein